MKRYPEYKNSQLGWVGKIPKHWEVIKFHYLSQESRRKNEDDIDREMLSLSSYTGIQVKQYEYENTKRSKAESLTYFVVEPNQLVVNPMWQIQRGIGVSYLHGIVSPGYRVYYIDLERLIPQYLHYLMRSDGYIDEYNKHIRGLTTYDRSVRKEDFEDIGVLLPSKQEQIQIANFLDRKTRQIDELIRVKERRIELLHEQRTVLINQAVTKGLDPNVEMRPSGVEWIGDICEHWEIKKLKHIVQGGLTNGLFKKKDQFGSGVKLINVTDMYQDDFLVKFEELGRVEAKPHEIETYAVEPGDIFFVRSSLKLEGVAASACITDVPEPTVFECHLVRLQPCPTQILFRYLINYLNSTHTRQRLITLANTVTMTTIAQPKLASIEVTLPPLSEQRIIVDFLDRKTKQIDELIATEQRKIELLKEYRQSLISEAVIGKIDVRNEV